MKKIITLLISPLFACMLAAIVFVAFFQTTAIKWGLQSYCQLAFHCQFDVEAIVKEEKGYRMISPQLSLPGIATLKAESVAFELSLSLLQQHLEASLQISHPTVTSLQDKPDLTQLLDWLKQPSFLNSSNISLTASSGKLIMADSNLAPLHFEGQLTQNTSLETQWTFFDEAEKQLLISFRDDRQEHTIEAEFAKVSCPLLSQYIFPERDWTVQKGTLEGTLKASRSSESLVWQRLEGDLFLKDLAVSHTPTITDAIISHAHFRCFDKASLWGEIEITEPASLAFYRDQKLLGGVDHLTGCIQLQSDMTAALDFKGLARLKEEQVPAQIQGFADFHNGSCCAFDLHAYLEESEQAPISARLTADLNRNYILDLKSIGKREFKVFQALLECVSPDWNRLDVLEGNVDALMQITFDKGCLASVDLKNLHAKELSLQFAPWQVPFGCKAFKGTLHADFISGNFWNFTSGELAIQEGWMEEIRHVNANLHADHGLIKNSHLDGDFGGLQGVIDLDYQEGEHIAQFHCCGPLKCLFPLLPPDWQSAVYKSHADEMLSLDAACFEDSGGGKVQGKISLPHEISFAFALIPSHEGSLFELDFWKLFTLKDGAFFTRNVSLERHISPILFPEKQFQLTGVGEAWGTFTKDQVFVGYDVKDFAMFNQSMRIEVPETGCLDADGKKRSAEYVFDFASRGYHGTVPIHNGTFIHETTKMVYTGFTGEAELAPYRVTLHDIETFCEGVFFGGDVDINYGIPCKGTYGIDIIAHTMDGTVSQVQNMLAHLNKPFLFLKLPIDGHVAFRERGGALQLAITPIAMDYKLSWDASITDGSFRPTQIDASIQDLCVNVSCHDNTMEIADLQATVLVGPPEHLEEYTLNSDRILFSDCEQSVSEFDLWISDKQRDVIRLAGSTCSQSCGHVVSFAINHELTHFGDMHPDEFTLAVKDWTEVDTLHWRSHFSLNTFWKDFQRLSRSGLLFLSKKALKEISQLQTPQGDFFVDLEFDKQQSAFRFHSDAQDIEIGSWKVSKCSLQGMKKSNTWTIDQLLIDQTSLAADFQRAPRGWRCNFLGFRCGDSLLVGLEGDYTEEKHSFDGKVNLLEINLQNLQEWAWLQPHLSKFDLRGTARATGKFTIAAKEGLGSEWHAELNGSLKDLSAYGLHFAAIEDAGFSMDSARGMTLSHAQTALLDEAGDSKTTLLFDHAKWDFAQNELSSGWVHFNLPVENLDWLARTFPVTESPQMLQFVKELKPDGSLAGTINITSGQDNLTAKLNLNEGIYHVAGFDHDLSHTLLEYSPSRWRLFTKYHLNQHNFWIFMHSNTPDFSVGELVVSDTHPLHKALDQTTPLTVSWKQQPEGFFIQQATGIFSGLKFQLAGVENSSEIAVQGSIFLEDSQKAAKLCTPKLADSLVNWEIGRGYELKGLWKNMSFHGMLLGHQFECKGYNIKEMQAELKADLSKIDMRHLVIKDPALHVEMPFLHLEKNAQNQYSFSVPQAHVKNLRPSLLNPLQKSTYKTKKPILITDLHIEGLHGILGSQDTYEGQGSLHFANPVKKNLTNTIFAIPAEILSRIGLDLSVLTPVTGTITFELDDGKVCLTKFKDMYSDGKLSKFYLAHAPYASFIDYDGNLNLHVKMKQYNLLFKLAELFTVSVTGTLHKPTYSLQKQKNEPITATRL